MDHQYKKIGVTMHPLNDTYTSTGAKFFAHEEAMRNLRNGKGQPIVTHVMLTDVCNHKCAFCSVQARAGDSLPFDTVTGYLDILLRYNLKAVILSGGGNPILYRCKDTGADFNSVVDAIHERGLEIGLITNGMPMTWLGHRQSWKSVHPATLDKLTWIRISMSGLDHEEQEVYVPDIDPSKTTLGFSYVAHDVYNEPADPHHGRVSRQLDLISRPRDTEPDTFFEERQIFLKEQMAAYAKKYKPRYIRLLPNCLEPALIDMRCKQLDNMARWVNFKIDQDVAFVQYKPPAPPKACYLGYVHPVLNCDGYVYPCDSCVLNEAAGHKFAYSWRMCHWSAINEYYDTSVHSLIDDPAKQCPGCVFTGSNEILKDVVDGRINLSLPLIQPEHVNFV